MTVRAIDSICLCATLWEKSTKKYLWLSTRAFIMCVADEYLGGSCEWVPYMREPCLLSVGLRISFEISWNWRSNIHKSIYFVHTQVEIRVCHIFNIQFFVDTLCVEIRPKDPLKRIISIFSTYPVASTGSGHWYLLTAILFMTWIQYPLAY